MLCCSSVLCLCSELRPKGLLELFYAVLYICAVICGLTSGHGLRELLYAVLYICAVICAQICSHRA